MAPLGAVRERAKATADAVLSIRTHRRGRKAKEPRNSAGSRVGEFPDEFRGLLTPAAAGLDGHHHQRAAAGPDQLGVLGLLVSSGVKSDGPIFDRGPGPQLPQRTTSAK